MKKILTILLACTLCSIIHSAEKKISNYVNEYGGITETYIINPTEKDYEQFTEVSFFYDENNQIRRTVYNLSSLIEEQTSYSQQEEIYSNGKMIAYKMIFSKAGQKKYGVKEITEIIDDNNETSELWYSNGEGIAKTSANSFTLNYPLYSLSFLEKEFEINENKSSFFAVSAKYNLVRTFVHFKGEYSELNKDDKKAIDSFGEFLSNKSLNDLYTIKSTVVSEGKEYTVYVQKNLVPYLKKDMDFLMAYGVMVLKGNLVLFMTEFSEIVR